MVWLLDSRLHSRSSGPLTWIQDSFTCYVLLNKLFRLCSSVVYSDQLFGAARYIHISYHDRWPVIRILNFPLQTFTYLREDDVDFWRKLVYRLPHKRMSHISRIVNTSNDAKRRISELRRLISYTSRDEDDQVETGNRSRPPSFPLTTANA